MPIHTLAPYLAKHPLFQGLDPSYHDLLTECASNKVFQPQTYIARQNEDANEFYLIREGKVSIEISASTGQSITILTLSSGEVLGWSWLFPPFKWHFDSRALELTRTLALDGKCLREKCENDSALGFELMKRFSKIMVNRLQATRLQLIDVYGQT